MLAPPLVIVRPEPGQDIADALMAMVRSSGSEGHPHLLRLMHMPANGSREPIAEALHYLCILHARYPSVIELAANLGDRDAPRPWLNDAADAFAPERHRLSQLAVAAGPAPQERGRVNLEELVRQQREALMTLVRSDRRGCLVGIVAAMMLDWQAVYRAMNGMAHRVGLDALSPSASWPDTEATLDIVRSLGASPAMSRALLFAAQQLLAQHRAFWDLLEARSGVRRA